MPISAIGSKRPVAEQGFTLIELMVVITIVALASAIVIVSLPDPRGRVIDDATRLAARVVALRDDAIIESRDTSLWVTASSYGFERRRRGQWQAIRDKPFLTGAWSTGTQALVAAGGRQRVVFDTTGAVATPVTLTLIRQGERASVAVLADGTIRVGS